MEAEDSLPRIQGGTGNDARGLLGRMRAEAVAKSTRRQFYQSDRVKKFHSMLLLTETLKARGEQMELKHQMEITAEEETRRFMAEIRRKELEAVEQERERARRREREQAAVFECLRQQLRHQDLTLKLEKEKEVEECNRWRERYEREKAEQRRREQEKKASARKAHEALMSTRDAIRAREAQRHKAEEERRRLADEEKDRRTRREAEEEVDRRRQFQRHKQNLADQLGEQLREKAERDQERDARAAAQDAARRGSELERKQQEADNKKAVLKAIAAAREERLRAQERMAEEQQRSARDTLRANKEADRAHWEGKLLERQKKKEERMSMDNVLRQQMADKLNEVQLSRAERLDFERKNVRLLAKEEEQFQEYAAGVIEAAGKTGRSTYALRKEAKQSAASCGLGPITGGMRAGYLVSSNASHARVPNYVTSTHRDIERLYTNADAHNNRRLDFIW